MSTISPLEQARRNRNWTRTKVEILTNGRITIPSLRRWEKGKYHPRADSLQILCELFGQTPRELGFDPNSAIMGVATNTPMSQRGIDMSDLIRRAVFSDLGSKLNGLVTTWPRTNYQYEELQTEIDKAVCAHNELTGNEALAFTRRSALQSVALTAIQLCSGEGGIARNARTDTSTILAYCAAGIAAVWHLQRGNDPAFALDLCSTYEQILTSITQHPRVVHQKAAAELLAQSLMLKGWLAQALKNSEAAILFIKQAIDYSSFAENVRLQAFAYRMMVSVQYMAKNYKEALSFAEQAEALIKPASLDKLTQSWIYSGLTYCQAFNGLSDESVASLTLARDLFDPHALLPPHMQYSIGVLYDSGGIASLRNKNYQEAATFFDDELTLVSPRGLSIAQVQAKTRWAKVEVSRDDRPRDMGLAISLLTEGITGARELGSKFWVSEAGELYDLFRIAWPLEPEVKKLGREHFGVKK